MSACYDWSIVGYGSHPVPGDPGAVAVAADRMRSTAEAIQQSVDGLRAADAGVNKSKSLDAALRDADEVAGKMLQAVGRYYAGHEALSAYGPALAQAKTMAEQALQAAAQARAEQARAARSAETFYRDAASTIDPVAREQYLSAYQQAVGRAQDADGNLSAAKARIHDAIALREKAQQSAVGALEMAISGKDINDTFWDRGQEVLDELAELGQAVWRALPSPLKDYIRMQIAMTMFIIDNLEWISLGLTVVGAILMFTPLAPIGGALLVAGRVVGVMAVVRDLIQMPQEVAEAHRTGDWSGVAFTCAAAVLALVPLSKVFGAIGKFRPRTGTTPSTGSRPVRVGDVAPRSGPSAPLPKKHPVDEWIDDLRTPPKRWTGLWRDGVDAIPNVWDIYNDHRLEQQQCRVPATTGRR